MYGKGQIARLLALLVGLCRTASICADSVENFKCPEQFGYYPDMEDCTKYFVCVFGDALHEKCTGGLYFSVELQTCNWPRNVECANGFKPEEDPPRNFQTPDDEVFSSSRKSPAKRPLSSRLPTNSSGQPADTPRPLRSGQGRGISIASDDGTTTRTQTTTTPAPQTDPPTLPPVQPVLIPSGVQKVPSATSSEDPRLYSKDKDDEHHEIVSNYDDPQQPDFDEAAPAFITSEGEIGIPGEPPQHLPASVGNIGVFVKPIFNINSKEADLDLSDYSKSQEAQKPPQDVRQSSKQDGQIALVRHNNGNRKDPDIPVIGHNNGHSKDPDGAQPPIVYDDANGRDGTVAPSHDYDDTQRGEYIGGQFEIIVPGRSNYKQQEDPTTTEGQLQWNKLPSHSNSQDQTHLEQPLVDHAEDFEIKQGHGVDTDIPVDNKDQIDLVTLLNNAKSNYSRDKQIHKQDSSERYLPPPNESRQQHRDFASTNNGNYKDYDVALSPVRTNNGNHRDSDAYPPVRSNNGNHRDPDVFPPVRTNNGNHRDPDVRIESPQQGSFDTSKPSSGGVVVPPDEDHDSYDLPPLDPHSDDFGIYTGKRQQRLPYETARQIPGMTVNGGEYAPNAASTQTPRPPVPQSVEVRTLLPPRVDYPSAHQREPVVIVQTDTFSKNYGEYDSPYYYDDYEAVTTTSSTTTPRPRPPVRSRRPTSSPSTIPIVVTTPPPPPPTTTTSPPVIRTRTRPSSPPVTRPSKVLSTPSRNGRPSRPQAVHPTPTPLTTAQRCDSRKCRLPDCRCGTTDIPAGLNSSEIPQIVLLTFDDAVNDLNHDIYNELFFTGRKNPNNCPILGTFYVSHEWTDYAQVQTLYARGHEIASHSISHGYGEKFSKAKWMKEIDGQREILHLYGGVKLEDIRGMRAPFLQIGGNKMFEMLFDANFTYDSSMPIFENSPPFWPYTLDYAMSHECMITPCPTKSFPGLWEVGMVMWIDLRGGRCSMADACPNPGDDDEVVEKMLLKNFNRHYKSNRSPFGLFFHSAWFNTQHYRRGFMRFLDGILANDDVWIVTNWQMIQWMRNPTPLSHIHSFEPWQCRKASSVPECLNPTVCNVWHQGSVRYMRTCQQCPIKYPWLENTDS